MQQLAGQDAMFLLTELDGFPMHIGGVSIYDQSSSPDGVVRFKDILALFESRLDQSPIFRRKLAEVPFDLDQPYWVDDDNFDLEFHVRHIALPQPGDWRQLCIQVARLHARPLDRSRALWEAYVIEGLGRMEGVPEGSFALYLKLHHCAADGISGMQFFNAFNDTSARPAAAEKPLPWQPKRQPSLATMLGKATVNNLAKPWQLYKLARHFLPSRKAVKQGLARGNFHASPEVPSTRFNGELSAHRVLDVVRFNFEDIRAIKNSVPGATVNDTLLAIVAGGMRRYLDSKGELPELPLVSLCPINVRQDDEEDSSNAVSAMNVSLCSDIAEPLVRLAKIHQETESAKAYNKAMGARFFMELTDSVPSGAQALLIYITSQMKLSEKNAMQNTAMTNVPGSTEQLYLCGAQLIECFGIGPLSPGMGLFHTVNSMVVDKKGTITLCFLSCREVMPDPEFYRQCLEESYAELLQACQGQSAKPASARKTRIKPVRKASVTATKS